MCDPVSLMVTSLAVSAGGQIMGGMQAQADGKRQQQQYNQQAELREEAAEADAQTSERNSRRTMGRRDAMIGASGFSTSGYSDVVADDEAEAALEREIIKFGGESEAFNLRYQGATARARGDNAMFAGAIGAIGTGLSGYSKISGGVRSGGNWRTSIAYG